MKKKTILTGFAIAVVSKGFVFVGNVTYQDGFYIIKDCYNIRRWGTSSGLGELAKKGPLENTKLDNYGTIRIPKRSLEFFIDTKAELWKQK